MTRNPHDEARELIALAGAGDNDKDLSGAQQAWLRAHLEECATCRDYAEAAGRAVRALRSQPLAADSALVRATQMRVRIRAGELRQRRERLVLVAMSCGLVAISSALTTPLIWKGFEWMGRWSQMPSPVWQVGFVLFWIAPTIAAGVLFLAHGTHLSGSNGAFRG
ncbi:MAG TPA: anti-sigma factor [Candidatus Sulfotelmatobacter sp.]|nr:anti-sigma factor [Candidatus Sulfotelmatobacter sp.]